MKSFVDSVDRVILHRQQEARAHLRITRSRIEEGRRRVSEPFLADQVVGLDHGVDVVQVYSERDSHDHLLRPFDRGSMDLEQVGFLEGFEAKVIVVQVPRVVNGSVKALLVLLDNFVNIVGDEAGILSVVADISVKQLDRIGEVLLGSLVEAGHDDARSELAAVGMQHVEIRCSLREQVVELGAADSYNKRSI
jgi:hypothetical protein